MVLGKEVWVVIPQRLEIQKSSFGEFGAKYRNAIPRACVSWPKVATFFESVELPSLK